MRYILSFFSSSWCQGLTAASDCGIPWTFLLMVLLCRRSTGRRVDGLAGNRSPGRRSAESQVGRSTCRQVDRQKKMRHIDNFDMFGVLHANLPRVFI